MSVIKTSYFNTYTKAAPLAVFRVLFGFMMFLSIIRFWSKGWIEDLYISPQFHFKYYGFDWVTPLGAYTYVIFSICALASLGVALGYKYKMSILIFFISFTYIELMDLTTYLNHYYFISLLAFILIFLPADVYFSLAPHSIKRAYIPRWCVDVIKLMLAIVYVYAGLSKLNSDWLLNAQPIKIWLSTQYDIPIIGSLLRENWVHYTLSWLGATYDLVIPFFLLFRSTRIYAFVAVVLFHLLTRIFFPIGMFPYIMIVSALIFFSPRFHESVIAYFKKIFNGNIRTIKGHYQFKNVRSTRGILIVFFIIQLLLPWRYLLYPGELFWTEEGYRFSWRVMLMEKSGYAQFKIVDGANQNFFLVDNSDFLTPFQEKEMATQPDFILQYAHYLGNHFSKQGHKNVEVYVDSFVTLNGRRSKRFIDPNVDLLAKKQSFTHNEWVLQFNDEIKGL